MPEESPLSPPRPPEPAPSMSQSNLSSNLNPDSNPLPNPAPVAEPVPQASAPVAAPTPATQVPWSPSDTEPASTTVSTASMSTVPPVTVPPKKSRKKLVAGSIIAAIVVLGLAGVGATYALVYSKPENAVLDGISKAISAEAVQASTVVTMDYSLGSGSDSIIFKKVTVKQNVNHSPTIDENAELIYSYGGKDYTVTAAAFLADSGDIFFRVANLDDSVRLIVKQVYGNELSDKAKQKLQTIENKWIKVTADDLKSYSPEAEKAYTCAITTYKKYANDTKVRQEVTDLYKQHPFLVVNGAVKTEGMLNGYNVTADQTKAKAFGDALKNTTAAKEIQNCSGQTNTEDSSLGTVDTPVSQSITNITDNNATTYTLWVHQFTHTLQKVDVTTKVKNGDKDTTITAVTNLSYDAKNKPAMPTSEMTIKEFSQKVSDFFDQLSTDQKSTLGSSTTARAIKTRNETNAMIIQSKAEQYSGNKIEYPATVADFAKYPESKLDGSILVLDGKLPEAENSVGYKRCSKRSAEVIYRDPTNNTYVAIRVETGESSVVTKFC